jgi:cytochrome c biogenesis protein CcdA
MLIYKIIWLALVDSINPNLITVAIALLLSQNIGALWAYIYGVFFTTLAQTLLVYFGLDKLLSKTLFQNQSVASSILVLIGGALIILGLYYWQHRNILPGAKTFKHTNYIKYIFLGSAITLAETPTAFLLLLAVVEVKKINSNIILTLTYFCIYAALYILPLLAIALTANWQEKRLKTWLNRRFSSIYRYMNILLSFSLLTIGSFILAIGISKL